MLGPCAKRTVTCIIVDTKTGEAWKGQNLCQNPQQKCPRGDMPSGDGYHLCKEVCQQVGHAEQVAAGKVKKNLKNGLAYLQGHSYACEECKSALRKIGVSRIRVGPIPGILWEKTFGQDDL